MKYNLQCALVVHAHYQSNNQSELKEKKKKICLSDRPLKVCMKWAKFQVPVVKLISGIISPQSQEKECSTG